MKISDRTMTYPECLRVRIEDGLSDAIVRAARQNRTTASEYVRTAVRARLIADGLSLPPLDAPTQREAA